jgi:hypothetical protein
MTHMTTIHGTNHFAEDFNTVIRLVGIWIHKLDVIIDAGCQNETRPEKQSM